MPPRNIRYDDRGVLGRLAWYYLGFNPIMIGLYGPFRTIMDLNLRGSLGQIFDLLFGYYEFFYHCVLLFPAAITRLFTALWGLFCSIVDFIHHPMRRSQRFRSRTSLWLTKITIILGIFHFVCFNIYISYLTVAPTLCWLDKDCRSFPPEVNYGDFLISVPAVPAVKAYNILTAPSTYEYFKLPKYQAIKKRDHAVFFLQASAQNFADIVRAVTESMPFSSAAFFSEEEVVPEAGASETAEETKMREGNTGQEKTSNKATMISSKYTPLSKTKKGSATNDNQDTNDLDGSKSTELSNERVEVLTQPTLYQKLLKTFIRIITNFPKKVCLSARSLYYTMGLRYVVMSLLNGDMSLLQGLYAATHHFWFIFLRGLYVAKTVHAYVVELVWAQVLAAENEPPAQHLLMF